jgi:SAM-dependent methyltransferase
MAETMRWVRFLHWFDRKCKGLCVRLGPHPKHRLTDDWHAWYLKHLRPGDELLDYGCGSRAHLHRAGAYLNTWVYGWDKMDQTPPPRQDNSFTVIMLLDVLQLIDDRPALLTRLHRLLTSNGRLLIALPFSGTTWRHRLRAAGLDGHYEDGAQKNYTLREMYEEIESAGFKVTHIEPTVYDTPLAGLIDLTGQVCWPLYHRLMRWKRERVMANWIDSTGYRLVCVKSS